MRRKYLKALLISRSVKFPKTHGLIHLNTLCISNEILTEFSDPMLGTLAGYAVRFRYPGNEPSLEEAREALAIARSVCAFARKWLGLKGQG